MASVRAMNAIGESLLAGRGPNLLAGIPSMTLPHPPGAIGLLELHADRHALTVQPLLRAATALLQLHCFPLMPGLTQCS